MSKKEVTGESKAKRGFMIFGMCVASFFVLLFLVWGGINVFKFAIYSEFYSLRSQPASIPGLKDGFVMQGMTYLADDEHYALAGYMNNGSASRIYTTDKENNVKYFTLTRNGEDFYGHTGGMTFVRISDSSSKIYIANECFNDGKDGGVYVIDSTCLNQESGTPIEIGNPIKANNNSSYIFSDDEYIYVGEFNGKGNVCGHDITLEDGSKNGAIITKYSVSDTEFSLPLSIYSVPDLIQGCAVKKDGTLILCSSYGLSDSHLRFYNLSETKKSGVSFDGVEAQILGECKRDIKSIAMLEDLDLNQKQDTLLTVSESGSSKYIFGSLFFCNKLVELKLE